MSRLSPIFVIAATLVALGLLYAHLTGTSRENSAPTMSAPKPVLIQPEHRVSAASSPTFSESVSPGQVISPSPSAIAMQTGASADLPSLPASGFTALPSPALQIDQGSGVATLLVFSAPAIFAPESIAINFSPAQRAEISALADHFADQIGEPPTTELADSDPSRARFKLAAYKAANETDFLIKQRYGHRAYVLMQMEAAKALSAP